ncbi:MAG: nucleotidyltransferase family protein [Promethearchaeota archaeon]
MKNKELDAEKIKEILKEEFPFLKKRFNVKVIGFFGSYAKGTASKNSDIDIFIEFAKPIGLTFIGLAEYLEKLFNKKVEILTREGLNSIKFKELAQSIKSSIIYI